MSSGNSKKSNGLSLWHFFTLGFGAILGTGWVLMVGKWIFIGGGPIPAILGFLICGLLMLPIGMVFGELTSALPKVGGVVGFIDRSFGSFWAFIAGWLLAFGNAILGPWESLAISALFANQFSKIPGFSFLTSIELYTIGDYTVYLYPTAIALFLSLMVIYLNLKGAKSVAKLSSIISKILFLGMITIFIIELIKGSPKNLLPVYQNFGSVKYSNNGIGFLVGIIGVMMLAPFSYVGFDTIPQYVDSAGDNANWRKIGEIIALSLFASILFYIISIYSFGSLVPWTTLEGMEFPALEIVTNIFYPLYIVLLLVSIFGCLGPMNSFIASGIKIIHALGKNDNLPKIFQTLDPKTGVQKPSLVIMGIFTLSGPFMGTKMLVLLSVVGGLVFMASCLLVSLSCLYLRIKEPELKRPYKVPGGKTVIVLASVASALIVILCIVPGSPAALDFGSWMIVLGWIAFGILLRFIHKSQIKQN